MISLLFWRVVITDTTLLGFAFSALSVAKAGSGLVVQQHLVVGYKACTSYMQLLLPYISPQY